MRWSLVAVLLGVLVISGCLGGTGAGPPTHTPSMVGASEPTATAVHDTDFRAVFERSPAAGRYGVLIGLTDHDGAEEAHRGASVSRSNGSIPDGLRVREDSPRINPLTAEQQAEVAAPRPPRMGIDEPDIDPAAFLEDVELRVGEVVDAGPFPEARKDLYKLEVDFGDATRQSAAGLTARYDPEDLVGSQVVAAVNLGTVSIAGFESQCLVTGVDDGDGGVVHLRPERPVPNGARVY